MKASRLRRIIRVMGPTEAINDAGTPVTTYAQKLRLRAERMEQSTTEFLSAGTQDRTAVVFRTRFATGIALEDQVWFGNQKFNIKAITPIGHDRGLELRCVAFEGGAT